MTDLRVFIPHYLFWSPTRTALSLMQTVGLHAMLEKIWQKTLMCCLFLHHTICSRVNSNQKRSIPIQILQKWIRSRHWLGRLHKYPYITRALNTAKSIDLQPPMPNPFYVGSVLEGVSQTNFPPCITVANYYTSMIRRAWKKSSQKPQFRPGCWCLADVCCSVETGLWDMSPVDQSIASAFGQLIFLLILTATGKSAGRSTAWFCAWLIP